MESPDLMSALQQTLNQNTTPPPQQQLPPHVAQMLANPPQGWTPTDVMNEYNAGRLPAPPAPATVVIDQAGSTVEAVTPPAFDPTATTPPAEEKKKPRAKTPAFADAVKVLLACAGAGLTIEQAENYLAKLTEIKAV